MSLETSVTAPCRTRVLRTYVRLSLYVSIVHIDRIDRIDLSETILPNYTYDYVYF